jgi:serine/threonine-protein kinase
MADAIYIPGQTVAGRYRIISPLSQGGMGAVYLARQISLDREVALKVILDRGLDPELLKRFDVEARAVCLLRHPNIITYHDYGRDDDGHPFLVMEYLAGYPGTRLLQGARRPIRDLVHVLAQVCSALHEAHAKGLVHRDLKWSNVMICPESHDALFAKLIDFGIMKAPAAGPGEDPLTRTGMILGTPQYMSPEAICGLPVDGRADQYALAIMLWEAIEGRRPFDEAPQFEILRRQVQDAPPPMRDGLETLRRHPQLGGMLARALEKHPTDRFPSILDFRDGLLAALQDQVETRADRPARGQVQTAMGSWGRGGDTSRNATQPGPMTVAQPPSARRIVWLGLATLAAAVLSALVVALIMSARSPDGLDSALPGTQVSAPLADTRAEDAPMTASRELGTMAPIPSSSGDPSVLRDAADPVDGARAVEDVSSHDDGSGADSADVALSGPVKPSPGPDPMPTREPRQAGKRASVPAPSVAEAKGEGTLTLLVSPWARVSIDGAAVGNSPILEHPLAAGAHRVVLSNTGVFKGQYAFSVTIRAGENLTRSVALGDHLEPIE